MKILVTGGTGFIGGRLCPCLLERGHELTVLTRNPSRASRRLPGSVHLIGSLDELPDTTRLDAIVNLAGEGIADRRWTVTRKDRLLRGRVDLTLALAELVRRLERKPDTMISASAVGFYGNAGGTPLTETSSAVRKDFSYRLCDAWESAAREVERAGVRLCILRIGVVMGAGGGMMARLLPLYRAGLGARLGDGSQWLSWIHIDDLVHIVCLCLETPAARGIFNAVAPEPVTQARFHGTLASLCRRPGFWRVPAWPLRMVLGEMSVMLLGGQRVYPGRLEHQGFRFRHGTIEDALTDVIRSTERR